MSTWHARILPSRASAPGHCAECDGPRDAYGPYCTGCATIPLLTRIDERYQFGEGVTVMGMLADRWEYGREFHPLLWGIGLQVEIDGGAQLTAGPWSLYLRRVIR